MAFADPQTVTISAVAQTMPRTSSGVNSGEFTESDGTSKLVVKHQYGKRTRREIRYTDTKIAANPFDTTMNQQVSSSVYLVVDAPPQGYTVTELKAITDGFLAYLTASSGAKVLQFLGGES